ncbi:conserved hypothetical protein [Frankia canadensis]|uniref:DUF58 domain-containing protein n=1 Tax=Frankia canadensis TaxID=1836972 RepID=A0A2I2KTL4_9ACTN|nr:DUF58 domain-containing protein [Frankia canadensis]SNQ48996.1 conserved hypothetical protein [Frankia canadensis]SOU56286.1 conserved hypothetical protein [Frankia canadensis]
MRDFVAALRGLTIRGRSFLAAGAACAVSALVLGEQDLLRIGLLIAGLPVLAAAVVSRTRYRLSCTRRLEPRRVTAGDRVSVRIQLENVSRSPSSVLLVEDTAGAGLGGGARFVLDRIEPGGRRDLSYALRATARGRYQIGPMAIRIGDPFGLCEVSRSFRSLDELIVAPAIERLPATRPRGSASLNADQRRVSGLVGVDETTTRPYRSGDDLRKVHWKTTARSGELMVRREEHPQTSAASILLDTRALAWPGGPGADAFEWAVSAVGAVGLHLVRGGYKVRLVTDRGPVTSIAGTTVGGLLDELSVLLPADVPSLQPALTALRRPAGGGDAGGMVVAVLGRAEAGLTSALIGLRGSGAPAVAILVDITTWGDAPPSAATDLAAARTALARAGWAVVIAQQGTSLATVWPRVAAMAGRAGAAGPAAAARATAGAGAEFGRGGG